MSESTDVVKHLWSIGLEDITAEYLEYNRPSLQAMKSCTELYKYKRWSEKDGFDIKPMVEIIVHESDQEMLTLAIGLLASWYQDLFRLESSNGLVAVGFIENFQTMYWNIHRHNPVKAVECGIIPAVVNILSNTSIVKLLRALVNFADNHSDSSIRTELEQGGIFENLTAIVKSDTADHIKRRVAGQIIETCFQHRVHVASSSIWPYDDNAEIDMKSGMAGYKHGNARTLVEMRYIQYLQSILCNPMWWIDITNQHIVEQWRTDSLDQNISPSTFNLALEQLQGFLSNSLFVVAVMDWAQLSQDLLN
ncbi:hypothetical protein BSLG_005837 [Batrachochytrium salamandrivorans]|nr:hypothetical protein BSLG_005837 [Batrachochytrium salamandrivorans]